MSDQSEHSGQPGQKDAGVPPVLADLGLRTNQWAAAAELVTADRRVGRVAEDRRIHFVIYGEGPNVLTECQPELLRDARKGQGHRPVVGDWVVFEPPERSDDLGTIVAVLPRVSQFSRKRAREELREQVVAANVDRVFLLMALDEDFSPRRLERYLSLSHEAGAEPVTVLTKADLVDTAEEARAQARAVVGDLAVEVVDPRDADSVAPLRRYLEPGITVAFLGSSGVGKSTLINRVLGEQRQREGAVRRDGKGRHTTSTRHLFRVPEGGLVIDTPGMRELGLWEADSGVRETFADVEAVAAGCRFGDCRHEVEPGCAVRAAIEVGELDPARVENYRKLKDELEALDRDLEQGKKRRRRGRRRGG